MRQPDITETPAVAPANRTQANADHIGISGQRNLVIVGKESELLGIPLTIVKGDRALPAAFLVVIEFTQMSDDVLPWSSGGADTFDEGVVEVFLTILCSAVAAQKHRPLLVADSMTRRGPTNQEGRSSLHADLTFSTTKTSRNLQGRQLKIANFFGNVRNIGWAGS